MVNTFADIYPSLEKIYMAAIMTVPMLALELLFMGSMYKIKNKFLWIFMSVLFFVLFFVFIRRQIFVGDKQFLKSMITHHSGAILMCREAKIKDNEIKDLCKKIYLSQQSEIDQMKDILKRLE